MRRRCGPPSASREQLHLPCDLHEDDWDGQVEARDAAEEGSRTVDGECARVDPIPAGVATLRILHTVAVRVRAQLVLEDDEDGEEATQAADGGTHEEDRDDQASGDDRAGRPGARM